MKSSGSVSPGTLPGCLAAIAVIVASFAAYWWLSPLLPAGNNGLDLLFLADGARYIDAGRWPHADFSIPVGALSYLLYWLAGYLLPAMPAYAGMHLLFFILISPLLLAAALAMPGWWARLALIGLVAGAVLLPFNTTASGVCAIDLYASYNRFGAGLSLAYLAWLLRTPKPRLPDAAILAWVVLIALFLKVIYLAVILAPLGILFVIDSKWRVTAIQACIGVLAMLGVIEIATGTVSAYLDDILAMSSVNSGRAIYFLFSFGYKYFFELLLAGGLILIVLWNRLAHAQDRAARLAAIRIPLVMAAAIFGIMVAESQSTGGLGVTAMLGLLAVPGLFAFAAPRGQAIAALSLAVLVGGAFITVSFEKSLCVLLKRQGPPQEAAWAQRFFPEMVVPQALNTQAHSLARLWTGATPEGQADWYRLSAHFGQLSAVLYLAEWISVDDAIEELERRGVADDLGRVTTLSFVDQFGFALGAQSADGIKNVLDIGRTIVFADRQQAQDYLSGADTVFAPTCALGLPPQPDRDLPWLTDAVEDVLASEFVAQAITPCWTMHRRLIPDS